MCDDAWIDLLWRRRGRPDGPEAGTDEWYETVAKSRPPKDRPWYHVLVDGSTHTTYVAERHLEPDDVLASVEHPLVNQ